MMLNEQHNYFSEIAAATGEFTQLLSAGDTTYQSGYVGIAGGGNLTRLANFRGGQLPPF